MRAVVPLLALLALPALAGTRPEIPRKTAAPQPTGAVHTVRGIPEACVRLEGVFTAEPDQPYRLVTVEGRPGCQERARFVEFGAARPSERDGWKLNDRIRIPSAECPSLQAVVDVWRRPSSSGLPAMDKQGRARVYLEAVTEQAARQGRQQWTQFAAEMRLEGKRCGS